MGNGWTLKSIEELKAPTNGAIAIGPFGSRMKSDCHVSSGVQVIRGTNISDTRTLAADIFRAWRSHVKAVGWLAVYLKSMKNSRKKNL